MQTQPCRDVLSKGALPQYTLASLRQGISDRDIPILSMSHQVPVLAQAAVFAVFALSGRSLTPQLAFPALALLTQLAGPLFRQSEGHSVFLQLRVCIGLIQNILDESETPHLHAQPCAARAPAAVAIKAGQFAWEPGGLHAFPEI